MRVLCARTRGVRVVRMDGSRMRPWHALSAICVLVFNGHRAAALQSSAGFIIPASALTNARHHPVPGAIDTMRELEDTVGTDLVTVISSSLCSEEHEAFRLNTAGFTSLKPERVVTLGGVFTQSYLDAQNDLCPGYWSSALSGIHGPCAAHWMSEAHESDAPDQAPEHLLRHAGASLAAKIDPSCFLLSTGHEEIQSDMCPPRKCSCESASSMGLLDRSDSLWMVRAGLSNALPLVRLATTKTDPLSQLYHCMGGRVIRIGKRALIDSAWRRMGRLLKSEIVVCGDDLAFATDTATRRSACKSNSRE